MTKHHDLDHALKTMKPAREGNYIFQQFKSELPAGVTPFATIKEEDYIVAVIPIEQAKATGNYHSPQQIYTLITIYVEYSLGAPGLTAAVAAQLATQEIPCNFISGFNYEHFLVPEDQATEAMDMLDALSRQAQGWFS